MHVDIEDNDSTKWGGSDTVWVPKSDLMMWSRGVESGESNAMRLSTEDDNSTAQKNWALKI